MKLPYFILEVTAMEKYADKLINQIWTTRVSRINAEKRLQQKETFIEGINIYYSCFTVLLSIVLLVKQNYIYSLLSLAMTIILMISILYFKSLRYAERARDYRNNYTELHRLEFRLSHVNTEEEIGEIEQKYCALLDEAENHIPFDYYKTVAESHDPYKAAKWTSYIKHRYYWGTFWRGIIKVICIILPPALTCLAYWGQSYGWVDSIQSMG